MAGKKGKSRGRKAKSGTPRSPAASTQAAACGLKPLRLEGPVPDHNGDPPDSKASLDGASGIAADRFAHGSYLPSTASSSRPGSQVSRVTGEDNPSPARHQAGTAAVAIGGDFRHANGSGEREADWRRRPPGDRDTGGDRDRPARDPCHNGESLSRSLYLRQSATRKWSWLGYSAKQFRSFAKECPPALDIGADQVRAKIGDVKCSACRDSLHNALEKGLARGGLPLTKLVKLAACRSREDPKLGEGSITGTQLGAKSANGRVASSSPNDRGHIESNTKCGADAVDRLRIRAPVTPDLLRQIIGVVQASAGASAVAPAASSSVGDVNVKGPGSGTAGRRLRDLSAEEWLSTYPSPSVARLEGNACSGLRGTGTESLAITRAQPSVAVSRDERNPWTLMERAERAKDNAFKSCGVIEVVTGVGVQDPTAASNGGVSASALAGVGTVSGVSSGSLTGSGGGSATATNMDWNPQLAQRLQEAETALVDWLTELTMALHGLTFQFTLAFVTDEGMAERGGDCGGKGGDGRDNLAESIALTEVLWTAYEESIKRQLDQTLEARRENLRTQSQPMGFALCFAAQNRACAAELLERKRAEMTALHEATIGVMRAGKVQPLLVRAEKARQRWSCLLVDEELHALDDLVERVLKARLQIFKCESFAYNDVMQAEQMADAQLKAVVQEGESRMNSFQVVVENRFSEELNPTVYPQSPALTAALQSWLSSFKTDWEGIETTQQLHAHIRQRHVQGLCQTLVAKKHQLKTSKEEVAELGKQGRKRDGKAGVSTSNGNGSANGVYQASSEQSEDLVKQRELEERCQSLVTTISLTQQEQIETCLTYRLFAVGQLHQRYRRLRLFFSQLVCRVAARSHQTRHLCGVDSDAAERVKMLVACLMLGAVEEACLRWTAVQNERQLVEGLDREDASLDAKRRKRERAKAKVRKNKNASAAATATATAEAAAAKGSAPSEDRTKGERTPTSESARDRASRMPAAGEKSINGRVGEAIARQGIATAVARVTTSPLPNGTAVGAGAGSRTGSRSRGGVGEENSLKADRFPTTPGWRAAERSAPVGDEDGSVRSGKPKARQSATAQNWRAWTRGPGNLDNGTSGRGSDRSRLRGGGGSFNLHGGRRVEGIRDHAACDSKPLESETRSRGFIGAEEAAYSGFGRNSATVGRAWMPHKNKPVTEEQLEMCVAAAASSSACSAASSSAEAASANTIGSLLNLGSASPPSSATAGKSSRLDPGGTGWSGGPGWRVKVSDGGGSTSGSDASQLSTPVSPALHSAQVPTSCSKQSNGVAAGVRDHASLQQPQHYAAPQAAPRPASTPEKGRTGWAGCGRGSSVAPEEELPEEAPAPLEPTEEASAGRVVNNAGGFIGGQEVLGAGKKLLMRARDAAAPASAELSPERQIARLTRGKVNNEDRRVSSKAAKVATSDSVEIQQVKPAGRKDERAPASAETMVRYEEELEWGDEEAYMFQFDTVNLPGDDVVDNAGLSGEGQEAQGSPESRRYERGVVENEHDPRKETEETAEEFASEPRLHCEVSPGSLADAEIQFDERVDSSEGSQDLGGGADWSEDGSSLPQPLQTRQLRGGVFFPANSPPPLLRSLQPQQQQHHQQHQEGYTAPHAYHYHHPLQQHQQEMLTQQHGTLQQPGFSHENGMYGVSHFHQHHPHQQHQHQQSHLPYQRGVGVSGHPLRGSAAPGGGIHTPGVGMQGPFQHRPDPSHPKDSQYGSNVGASMGSGQHSPHGGHILSPLGGQYGVGHHLLSMMQQQGSTPGGYWGGEMMHYHVPGQHMMARAPGGIGVTGGQAVYYPPPPRMMQGDGSGQDQNGISWHAGGGGHMALGMVPSLNILMNMAGGMPTQMPWIPDGGQQHYVHHLTPQQQDWSSRTHGMAYAPPSPPAPSLQQHQNQERHWKESENLPNGVGDVTVSVNGDDSVGARTQSLNGHERGYDGGQTLGGHDTESMSPPLDKIEGCTSVELDAVALGAQEGLCEARTGMVSLFSSAAVDSSVTAGAASAEWSGAPLAVREEVRVTGAPEPSEEQCGGGLVDPGRPEGLLANDAVGEDADEPFHPRPTDGLQAPEAPSTENDVREEGGVRSAAVPGEGGIGAAVAAVVAAGGTEGAPRSRKGKEKGQKEHAQGHGGSRQATVANGTTSGAQQQQQGGSPAAGRGKRRGRRGGNRLKPGAMAGVVSTAKNGLPSPSSPMTRGLANASGQNNCFLNVVVQSLWHLDAFRAKFGGNSISSTPMAAWGKKPRAWGAAVTEASKDKTSEESSQRVESALRALFRELSGERCGDGGQGKGKGAGITGTTSASVEALRVALAKVPGGRFALGKMDDAAEAMETILDCLVQGASAAAIRQVFNMRIREVLTCPKCGIFSPELPTTYDANVFYAHVSTLQEAKEKHPVCSFAVALREASLGDLVACSNADCPLARRRERLPSRRSITGELPSVFSLGLVWNNWGAGPVTDLLQMISPVIDLDVVFRKPSNERGGGGIPGMACPLADDVSVGKAHLRTLYCFQVQKHHYVAFVYSRAGGEWLLLDDDKAIPIGPDFSGVMARCKKDKLHPSLLFYERQHPLA